MIIGIGSYITLYLIYNFFFLFIYICFFIKNRHNERDYLLHQPKARFAIIIPAHNEELLIRRLLRSIKDLDYPKDLFKTIVVADNCVDKTYLIASEEGAIVIERRDAEHSGKGYAIKYALEKIGMAQYDAVLIVDADSMIEKHALKELNEFIMRGYAIIQCYNGVANTDESWFTRLENISNNVINEILYPTKQRLGLSSCLLGDGMCFLTKILAKYGWDSVTGVEDWEYFARMIINGERIAFARDARVYHQESTSLIQATSQRVRWASGRFGIGWKYGFKLFYNGLVHHNIIMLDASLALIFPNPSLELNVTIFGFMLSFLHAWITGRNEFIIWFCCLLLMQFIIFLSGVIFAKEKIKAFLSIFFIPIFLVWKVGIDIFSTLPIGRRKWLQTKRRI